METKIRKFKESDLESLIGVYKSAFAEPPWNEFMKCTNCGVEYGLKEVEELVLNGNKCKRCGIYPVTLREYWTREDIIEDLEFCKKQQSPIILVAENDDGLIGYTWGYKLPFEKFPFLEGLVPEKSSYMDEIAVKADKRLRGIGTMLGKSYLEEALNQGMDAVTLRTDERNVASMALFRKLGSGPVTNEGSAVYDPEYKNRIYLIKYLR